MASNSEKVVLVIECVDCGTTFDVSAEEQAWYEEKGFQLPKRCHKCRKSRRGKIRESRLEYEYT